MLVIGRALMGRPSLLLLDEPSMGLALLITTHILDVIRETDAQATTVLLVECPTSSLRAPQWPARRSQRSFGALMVWALVPSEDCRPRSVGLLTAPRPGVRASEAACRPVSDGALISRSLVVFNWGRAGATIRPAAAALLRALTALAPARFAICDSLAWLVELCNQLSHQGVEQAPRQGFFLWGNSCEECCAFGDQVAMGWKQRLCEM
jgi:hypothetical protein